MTKQNSQLLASVRARLRVVKMIKIDNDRTKVEYADGRSRIMPFKKSDVEKYEELMSVKRIAKDIKIEKKKAKLKKKNEKPKR